MNALRASSAAIITHRSLTTWGLGLNLAWAFKFWVFAVVDIWQDTLQGTTVECRQIGKFAQHHFDDSLSLIQSLESMCCIFWSRIEIVLHHLALIQVWPNTLSTGLAAEMLA